MILKTVDGKEYKVKWVEYWNENERMFLAKPLSGELLKFNADEVDKIEEGE